MTPIEEAIAAIETLRNVLRRPGSTGQFEYVTLRAIEQWARRQLPFCEGEEVEVNGLAYTLNVSSGWYIYRDRLADGMRRIAGPLEFNRHSDRGLGAWHSTCEIGDKTFSIPIKYLTVVHPF